MAAGALYKELLDQIAADRSEALRRANVSGDTLRRLDTFIRLLLARQQKMNLIGASTIPAVWTRHVLDSLQLIALAPQARRWLDLGSGGGFPGLVIACAMAQHSGAEVHLVEKSTKKSAFLNQVVRELRLPALVHCERIEEFTSGFAGKVDVVTARALAPLTRLCSYVAPFVKKGAEALLMKGQDVDAELTEASKSWSIDARTVPSRSDPGGRILVVSGLETKK